MATNTTRTRATPAKYAEGSSVSISKSREEIEKLLKKYGATGFMYGEETTSGKTTAAVGFQMRGRHYRLLLPYPMPEKLRYTPGHIRRTDAQMEAAHQAEIKRLWRSLTLLIKAKLEAVHSEITSIEHEFQPDTVLSNNQTFYEWAEPQITKTYESGEMPPFLPGISSPMLVPRRLKAASGEDGAIEGEVSEL